MKTLTDGEFEFWATMAEHLAAKEQLNAIEAASVPHMRKERQSEVTASLQEQAQELECFLGIHEEMEDRRQQMQEEEWAANRDALWAWGEH